MEKNPKTVVILPCYNEAAAISGVIFEYRNALPMAEIHVFDNASTDDTKTQAEKAGAIVHFVAKRGKGNVVKTMFRDIEADYYLMADGDSTYPAEFAQTMLSIIERDRADMVVGVRMEHYDQSQSRLGHKLGNNVITKTVNYLFDSQFHDLLSGYRVLSNRFVKSIPLFSEGFEVETSMSIHAIEVDAKIIETPVKYRSRAEGTTSKLNTLKDGFKIGMTILSLFKDHRPKFAYGILSLALTVFGLAVGIPVVFEFLETGLVPRFPSAILASGLIVLASLTAFTGIIISAISKTRREVKKLAFLSLK